MDDFTFVPLSFCLVAEENLKLPSFKGATLRGRLGYMLKRLTCSVPKGSCRECVLNSRCVYGRVFEPNPSLPSKRYASVPRPFALFASPDDFRGKSLIFNLTLIGDAAQDLPYFVYAFDILGKEGLGGSKSKFDLEWVKLVRPGREDLSVYNSQTEALSLNCPPVTWADCMEGINSSSAHKATLLFHSPLRIKEKGDLMVDFSFPTFISRLKERIELLSHLYCGAPFPQEDEETDPLATKVVVEKSSLRWQELERYSSRQKTKMKLGGLIGMVTFKGDLTPFMPYLVLGQHIHVGQGTTFGLGKYEILEWE